MPSLRNPRAVTTAWLTLESTFRDRAGYRKRLRKGLDGYGRSSINGTVPTGFRNDIPVRLDAAGNYAGYVYRGTGYDQMAGQYGEKYLDAPYSGDGRWAEEAGRAR